MMNTPVAPAANDHAPAACGSQLYQVYVRNLNFAVSKSIIVEDIANSGLIAMDTLVEVRVARVGRAACWQGNEKMCSAFVIFNNPTAAQLLGNHWHGREHRVIGGFKPLECKIEICPAVPQQTQQQQEHSFPLPPPPPPVPPQLDATTTASTDNTTTSSQPCKGFKNNLTSKGPPPHSAVWQATKHSVGPCPSPIQGGFFGFRDLMPPPPRPLDEVFRRLGGPLPRNSLPNTPPAEPTRDNDAQKNNKKGEKDEKQEVKAPQDETKKDDDDDQDKKQEVNAPQDETKKDEKDEKQEVKAPQDEPKKEDDDDQDKKQKVKKAPQDETKKDEKDEKDKKQEVEAPQDEPKKEDDDDQDKKQEVEAPQDEPKKEDDDDQDKKQEVKAPQNETKKDDDDDSEDDGEEPNNNLQNGRVRVKLETKSETSEERDLLPVVGPAEPDEEEHPTETPSYNGDEEEEASSAHFDPYQGLSDFEVDEEKEVQSPWKRRALKRQELLHRHQKKAHVQQQKKKEKKYDERKEKRKEFTGLLCEGWSENVVKVQRVWSSI